MIKRKINAIDLYSLNKVSQASHNFFGYDKGSVRFKPGTPLQYRLTFLKEGGENLSKYNTYVYVDKKTNTLNLKINKIATGFHKLLTKLGLRKIDNVKTFPIGSSNSYVNKKISEFISTDSIHDFVNSAGLRKRISENLLKLFDMLL